MVVPISSGWGPPDISGSINTGVDAILGGIQNYRLQQELANLPRTADGSPDFHAAAIRLLGSNPVAAQQLMKMQENLQLQDYRNRHLKIQERAADIAADKSSNIQAEGKIFHFGPTGNLKGYTDIETGVFTPAGAAPAAAPAPAAARPSAVGSGVGKQPTEAHLKLLQDKPDLAPMFDEIYGAGSATRYLAGGGPAAPAAAPAPPAPAAPAPEPDPLMKRQPGESYDAYKERTKQRAKEKGTIDNPELKKADDAINSSRNTLVTLGEMLELNKRAFHGPGAQIRGTISSLTGIGGKQAGADTVILQNKITGGALEQLRATFGGNPTEGERAILLQVQGSVSQAADVRERIFKDAADLVRRRIIYNQKYANAVRNGNQHLMPAYTDNLPLE